MNQRIRQSGLSSKEICFKRDLISNTEKKIEDSLIADNIISTRTKKHSTQIKETDNIQVGHNVFIKNDKSKVKARELYKVVDVFIKDNESLAVIQKHNSQFRLKRYNVKVAELLLLPGQTYDEPMLEDNYSTTSTTDNSILLKKNHQQNRLKLTDSNARLLSEQEN